MFSTLDKEKTSVMTDLFEGKPDARQSTDENQKVSRFRPVYRALSDKEKDLHDRIKKKAEELETLFDEVSLDNSRYKALAVTSLEVSIMWIIKQLTGNK